MSSLKKVLILLLKPKFYLQHWQHQSGYYSQFLTLHKIYMLVEVVRKEVWQ